MFSYYFFVFAFAFAIILTDAKKASTCRQPSILQNVDISRLLGLWYEYARHNHDFEAGCDCLTSQIEVDVEPNTFQISNCCQMAGRETQSCAIGINRATLTNPATREASFQYTRVGSTVESHIWVVDTDYDNYLILNGCDHISDNEEREIFWILSRDRELAEDEISKINDVLQDHNFSKSRIIHQKQDIHLCQSKRV